MKRSTLFLTLLPLLLLSSCEKGVGESLNEEKNGLGLFQYGEVPSLVTSVYGDYCIEDDGTGVLKALENKENVFIVQTADDCSHCQKLEPRLCEFLSNFPVKTFLFEAPALSKASNVKAAFEKIQEVYPSFTFKMEFPRATLVSSSIVEDSFLFSGYTSSLNDLCDLLLHKFHTENIVYFEKEESFTNYLKNNSLPGYVYSSLEEFNANDKEEILSRSKKLAIYESSDLDSGYYRYDNGLKTITKEEALRLL